jgi:hypothetical protein
MRAQRSLSSLFVLVILLESASAFAGYDDTWFIQKSWSGEYPLGFSVTKKRTTLMARSGMDKDLPRDVACEMPYLALIHPWNKERIRKSNLQFFSATKILKMVAKEDFDFGDDITVKKGEVVEYIANGAEGFFGVRIGGKPYDADQSLFQFVETPTQDQFVEDDWVLLACQGGNRAYIFVYDLGVRRWPDASAFVPGISDEGPGLAGGPSSARDLTEQEVSAMEKAKGAAKK